MSKTYVGARLRRLRQEQGLSQVALARALEISPAYLNQIEQNSRPLTVPVLLRLNAAFGWDVQVFSEAEAARKVAQLRAALAVQGIEISALEQRHLVADRPELADALIGLHQKLGALEEGGGAPPCPASAARGWFERQSPYFDRLDRAAESAAAAGPAPDYEGEIARILAIDPPPPPVRASVIAGLYDYARRAERLPYLAIFKAAEAAGYDLDALSVQFAQPIREIAARFLTLQRPEARGVPFFTLEVDRAGHVLARASVTGFALGRGYGACPLWPVFDAFASVSGSARAVGEMPDGARYLWLARRIEEAAPAFGAPVRVTALALGCETRHGSRVAWGRGLALDDARGDLFLGPGCRVCARKSCPQRAGAEPVAPAAPPLRVREAV